MRNLRTFTLGLAAGAAVVAFAGPALALDEITFGTNWVAEAEHGGYYQAVADGTYDLAIETNGAPVSPLVVRYAYGTDFETDVHYDIPVERVEPPTAEQ